MKESIETRVMAVVARHFNLPPSKVRLDAAFVGDLGGDPLDLIELGYQLETAFNVHLSPSQRDTLTTPRAVVDFNRGLGRSPIAPSKSASAAVSDFDIIRPIMANVNWCTVALLVVSNLIMLYAWYGHLKSLSGAPIWMAILVSWSIALVEYCFAVPANRMGSKTMSLEQLKITQEAIALLTFVPFSLVVMRQPVSWNYAAAAVCIFGAVYFIFRA